MPPATFAAEVKEKDETQKEPITLLRFRLWFGSYFIFFFTPRTPDENICGQCSRSYPNKLLLALRTLEIVFFFRFFHSKEKN